MLSILGSIVATLASPLTEFVKGRQQEKAQKVAAKATVDEILANAAANDTTTAAAIALVQAQNQAGTWKDEFALITISAPYWVSMILGLAQAFGMPIDAGTAITAMFTPMAALPVYWQNTFQLGMGAALGITAWKRLRN